MTLRKKRKRRNSCESRSSRRSRRSRRSRKTSKKSKKSRKHARRRSKKKRSSQSDDCSSSASPKKLSEETKQLISAIKDHVLPLLETKSKKSEKFISKNRVLFALNRAAQRALKQDDVFGCMDQLKEERNEADKIVAEFLDREQSRESTKAQMSLIAPKCALCGAPCAKCAGKSGKKKSKRKTGTRGSVSWGEAEVMDFEMSDTDNPGAGFYPDPDSDSDEDEEKEKEAPKRKEVDFDLEDFKDNKKSPKKGDPKITKTTKR